MFFFFNDTATTEIYTLSLHDALPISDDFRGGAGPKLAVHGPRTDEAAQCRGGALAARPGLARGELAVPGALRDRESTRLNSSHANISYAVFCLKKKKNKP